VLDAWLFSGIGEELKEAISKPRFWKTRASEIKRLEGEIDDLLDFSGVEKVSAIHEKLSVDIMNLAKRRHEELTGEE